MTQNNLNGFLNTLNDDATVFHIDGILKTPDIISRPTGVETYNIIMQTVNDFLERYKYFVHFLSILLRHCVKDLALIRQLKIVCALDAQHLFAQ